jgi:hypothetical protein
MEQDKELSSLHVKKILAVTGRAVIRDLVVGSITYENSSPGASPPLSLLYTAPLPLPSSPVTRFASAAPSSPPSFLTVQTACMIPLASAGIGAWLNLQECAHFDWAETEETNNAQVQPSSDQTTLIIAEPGIYRVDVNLRIGHCGHGLHSLCVGIGINGALPRRVIASCQSYGSTLDLTGAAVGFTLLHITKPGSFLDIYLRDESDLATDANIFQGTLLFTRI